MTVVYPNVVGTGLTLPYDTFGPLVVSGIFFLTDEFRPRRKIFSRKYKCEIDAGSIF